MLNNEWKVDSVQLLTNNICKDINIESSNNSLYNKKKEDSKVTYTLIIYPNSLIYEPPITAAFVQKNSGQTKSSSRWIA